MKIQNDFIEQYRNTLNKLIRHQLIQVRDNRISLTDKGRDISNRVFVEFMD